MAVERDILFDPDLDLPFGDEREESLLDHLRAVERTDRDHVFEASRNLVSSTFRAENISPEENFWK